MGSSLEEKFKTTVGRLLTALAFFFEKAENFFGRELTIKTKRIYQTDKLT